MFLAALVGALAATAILTLILRRVLRRFRPGPVWRYGAHVGSLMLAIVLGAVGGVGGRGSMTVDALLYASTIYPVAQVVLFLLDTFMPKATGLGR